MTASSGFIDRGSAGYTFPVAILSYPEITDESHRLRSIRETYKHKKTRLALYSVYYRPERCRSRFVFCPSLFSRFLPTILKSVLKSSITNKISTRVGTNAIFTIGISPRKNKSQSSTNAPFVRRYTSVRRYHYRNGHVIGQAVSLPKRKGLSPCTETARTYANIQINLR